LKHHRTSQKVLKITLFHRQLPLISTTAFLTLSQQGVIVSKGVGNLAQKRIDGGLDTMRNQAESTQDSTLGVIPCASWRVIEVHTLTGYRLAVRFVDGTTGEVDLSCLIMSDNAGIFAQFRDLAVFAQAHVEYGVVVWPGEIDLAPDAMYDEIKKQGQWIPE
jgi:hypothetical protein